MREGSDNRTDDSETGASAEERGQPRWRLQQPPLLIRQQLPGDGQEADPYTSQAQRSKQRRRENIQPPASYAEDDSSNSHASTPERENAEACQEQNQQEKSKKEEGWTNTVKSIFHPWKRVDFSEHLLHFTRGRGEQSHRNVDGDLAHREQETEEGQCCCSISEHAPKPVVNVKELAGSQNDGHVEKEAPQHEEMSENPPLI